MLFAVTTHKTFLFQTFVVVRATFKKFNAERFLCGTKFGIITLRDGAFDFYTLPHKKWRGIFLYPPKISSVLPAVHQASFPYSNLSSF